MTVDLFNVEEAQRAWPRVSPSFVVSLGRYFNGGLLPGGFLQACLRNDLTDAVRRADETSMATLRDLVGLLIDHAPSVAWGSKENVEEWLKCLADAKAKEGA